MICFVSSLRPSSVQSDNKKKKRYQENLKKEFEDNFKSLYPHLPINNKLYSKLVYIYFKETDLDVDNMSKPFVDAFSGVIYPDDNVINHRVCTKIKFEDFQTFNLKIDKLPKEVAEKFNEFLENGSEHIVYYEIDIFTEDMVSIGGVNK